MKHTLTIHFPTEEAKLVFRCEMVGQISDGMWENTRNTGWEYWADANCVVGTKGNFGVENMPFERFKRNFQFTNKNLLDVIGGRIKQIIELVRRGITDEHVVNALIDWRYNEYWKEQLDTVGIHNEDEFQEYAKKLQDDALKNVSDLFVKNVCRDIKETLKQDCFTF